MYIIEFEKGVYSNKGKGDPARTLKIENAQRFSDNAQAKEALTDILEEIKAWRKFPNACIRWLNEVSGALKNIPKWNCDDCKHYPCTHQHIMKDNKAKLKYKTCGDHSERGTP